MKCRRCGSGVDDKWKFCPRCGSRVQTGILSSIFERMEKEMKATDKDFERDFEVLDISPFFRKPTRSGGFSIKILKSGREKPKFSVKTFGNFDKREVEGEMGKLGLKNIRRSSENMSGGNRMQIEKARTTEEPKTSVKNIGDRILVEISLPGVKSSDDIEIRPLENSIEVKALAGDKAYFKILTKPEKSKIINKRFENHILSIEIVN